MHSPLVAQNCSKHLPFLLVLESPCLPITLFHVLLSLFICVLKSPSRTIDSVDVTFCKATPTFTKERTLSQDMSTLSAYLQTWRLKLSHTKTMTAAFHLNNQEAKGELKVYNNSRLLPFCPTPNYLGVKLDRLLTFRHHLVALRKKLSLHVTLLRRLVGSGWGAGAKTLCIATLSLVYSTAEYCAPVWCRSAHTRLIDSVLNNALCIVTGCLHPTPTDHLPVLSGIQPAELC